MAAINPAFAAALAAGQALDGKALYAGAVLAEAYANADADAKELEEEIANLELEDAIAFEEAIASEKDD
jgi:hypothetical protein